MRTTVAAAVVLLLTLASSASNTQTTPVRFADGDEVMGATFSVVLYGHDRETLARAARAAFDEAHRLDRLLSNYRSDSELSRVNREAAQHPVVVSAELFRVLEIGTACSRESEGAFDMTVGPLMKVWGFYKDEGHLPPDDELARARSVVGYQHVHLDANRMEVRFDRPGVEIDPGGIGKGYAVDRMAAVIRRAGVSMAEISAGGSSIFGIGAPPDDPRGWRFSIRRPDDPHRAAAEVWLRDMSLSTSGSTEKFFRANGQVYSHIMDPRLGRPAQGALSVSVLAPRTVDSEVWAKPYFVNGRRWTAAHVPKSFRVLFCGAPASEGCSWISQ